MKDSYTFYRLLYKLLETYNKKDIFLRTNNSLKYPHKKSNISNSAKKKRIFLLK